MSDFYQQWFSDLSSSIAEIKNVKLRCKIRRLLDPKMPEHDLWAGVEACVDAILECQ